MKKLLTFTLIALIIFGYSPVEAARLNVVKRLNIFKKLTVNIPSPSSSSLLPLNADVNDMGGTQGLNGWSAGGFDAVNSDSADSNPTTFTTTGFTWNGDKCWLGPEGFSTPNVCRDFGHPGQSLYSAVWKYVVPAGYGGTAMASVVAAKGVSGLTSFAIWKNNVKVAGYQHNINNPQETTLTYTGSFSAGDVIFFELNSVGDWSNDSTDIHEMTIKAVPATPTDISNMKLWLKADAITGLNDGDPVASWTDSSGLGNAATQSTGGLKPLYKTNIVNSLPVVRFDGTDDTMALPSITPFTDITVFIVHKTSGDNILMGDGADNIQFRIGRSGSETLDIYDPNNQGDGVVHTRGVWAVTMWKRSFTTCGEFSTNGAWVGFCGGLAGTTGTLDTLYGMYGLYGTGSGDVSEAIVYFGNLKTVERQAVEDYLGTKYGVTITH